MEKVLEINTITKEEKNITRDLTLTKSAEVLANKKIGKVDLVEVQKAIEYMKSQGWI